MRPFIDGRIQRREYWVHYLQVAMSDRETSALVGLKREIKAVRAAARVLKDQNDRWRSVAQILRKLAGLDEDKFKNLLQAESLPCE